MKYFRLITIIFLIFSSVKAENFTANWGDHQLFKTKNGAIDLFKLSDWKIRGSTDLDSDKLPFYSDTEDTLIFTTTFNTSIDSLSPPAFFKGNGFLGNVEVLLNDVKIFNQINDCAPFSVQIQDGLLKNGRNKIKIRIKRSNDLIDGYPQFTRLFSEPVFIGISRPFFISFDRQPLIQNWTYNLKHLDQKITANFNYSVNTNLLKLLKKADGLSFEQRIIDNNNKTISRRAFDISDSKEIIINVDLSYDQLWSADNPNVISIIYYLKRYGQAIESDTIKTGLKTLFVEKNKIFINQKTPTIKGVNYYQNLKSKSGSLLFNDVVNHLKAIKSDGFNAVRFISHIPDELFLSVADTLGLYVFVELPVKRYPESLFTQDYLLENMKSTLLSTISRFMNHPSLIAIGLGQEILLTPAAQKFYFILNGFTPRPVPLLTYISPVPEKIQALEFVTDFYMLDSYSQLSQKQHANHDDFAPYTLNGKTGFNKNENYLNPSIENFSLERRLLLKNEITTTINTFKMQGGFLDSFMDWFAQSPSHQTIDNENPGLIPNGLYDTTFAQYEWVSEFDNNIWNYQNVEILETTQRDKSTNIFSITMFFGSLIFLFFYRRYPRLSENYRRSLKHPYGFYVDMRERRIIPVFNSFIVGVHNSLILATFFGSFVYYWNDSFLVEEILTLLFPKLNIYSTFLNINHSAYLIIIVLFILFFLHPLIMGLLLKMVGFLSKHSIRLRQALAIGLWSGSPFIFMLPVSLAAYHFILNDQYVIYLLLIAGFFILWVHLRLINGIRVLTLSKFRTIFIILLLFYTLPLVIFGLFFSPQPMWSDYIITLLNSHSLF